MGNPPCGLPNSGHPISLRNAVAAGCHMMTVRRCVETDLSSCLTIHSYFCSFASERVTEVGDNPARLPIASRLAHVEGDIGRVQNVRVAATSLSPAVSRVSANKACGTMANGSDTFWALCCEGLILCEFGRIVLDIAVCFLSGSRWRSRPDNVAAKRHGWRPMPLRVFGVHDAIDSGLPASAAEAAVVALARYATTSWRL